MKDKKKWKKCQGEEEKEMTIGQTNKRCEINRRERGEEDKDTAGKNGGGKKLFSPPGICAGLIIISYINLIVLFLVYFQASAMKQSKTYSTHFIHWKASVRFLIKTKKSRT